MEISIVIKMQQLKFETSMKNIPLGGNKEYVMQLTHSIRKVVYAMSWAAFIFHSPAGPSHNTGGNPGETEHVVVTLFFQ